jgi:hypothetical protein
MRRFHGWLFIITMALTVCGCGKTDQPAADDVSTVSSTGDSSPNASTTADPAAKLEAPARTVYDFLEAIRTGNDEKANLLLSTVARDKLAEMDFRLTPKASDTARFSIDSMKYVGEDGAQVAMTWTDMGLNGKLNSDKAAWVLRKEAEGWRVVGMAAEFFPGEEPIVLNFENPAEVKKKLEEVSNRLNGPASETESRQAEQKDASEEAVRR